MFLCLILTVKIQKLKGLRPGHWVMVVRHLYHRTIPLLLLEKCRQREFMTNKTNCLNAIPEIFSSGFFILKRTGTSLFRQHLIVVIFVVLHALCDPSHSE